MAAPAAAKTPAAATTTPPPPPPAVAFASSCCSHCYCYCSLQLYYSRYESPSPLEVFLERRRVGLSAFQGSAKAAAGCFHQEVDASASSGTSGPLCLQPKFIRASSESVTARVTFHVRAWGPRSHIRSLDQPFPTRQHDPELRIRGL